MIFCTLWFFLQQQADLGLKGLYEPPRVVFTFETIGWTILAWLLVFLFLLIVFFTVRHYIKNRYRREALKQLESINDSNFEEVFVILKRTAIQVFGREKVGQLYAKEWLAFLEESGKKVQFLYLENEIHLFLYQQQSLDVTAQNEILNNAKRWIKTHAK